MLVIQKQSYIVATYLLFLASASLDEKSSCIVATYLFLGFWASGNQCWCWVPSPLASGGAQMKI